MITRRQIAPSYAGFYGQRFEEFVDTVVAKGFTAVQLIPDQQPNLYSSFEGDRLRAFVKQIEQHGLAVHVHNVFYDINLVSLVTDVRDGSFEITRKVLRLAKALGARTFTIHPGYMFPGWRNDPLQSERFWYGVKTSMERISELADQFDIQILIENGSYFITDGMGRRKTPLHVGITIDEMERLLGASSRKVGLSLDIGKAIVSGLVPSEVISRFGERLGQVQLSNWRRLPEVETALAERLTANDFYVVFEGGQTALEEVDAHFGNGSSDQRH